MKHSIPKFVLHHRKILTLVAVSAPMAFLAACTPSPLPVNLDVCLDGDINQILDRCTTTRRDFGSQAEVLIDGERSYKAIVDLIRSAKDHINVETLNFDADEDQPQKLGLEIARLLVEKARQGVQVNVIIDVVFQQYISKATAVDILRAGGVKVRYFVPPLNKILMGQLLHRTHKKIFVADGRRALVGGSNLGSRYLGRDQWRDTNLALTGPAVASVQREFLRDWKKIGQAVDHEARYFPSLAPTGDLAVRVIDQRPGQNAFDINQAAVVAIRLARRRIDIEAPYFNPTGWMADELIRAAARGVRVRVLTNSETSSNMIPLYWSGAYNFNRLVDRGIQIYLWNRGKRAIHSKVFAVDDTFAMISSYNFSHRSILWDAENGVIFTEGPILGQVRDMLDYDFDRDFIVRVNPGWILAQGRRKHSLWGVTHLFGWLF